MFPRINPTTTQAWKSLQQHAQEMSNVHMKELFKQDSSRFDKYALAFQDILIDFSKNRITDKTISLLLQLAEECKLKEAIQALFNGDLINETEKRAVLHVALRNFSEKPVYTMGADVMPDVKRVQEQMKSFCEKVH